jgi:hypothetical protein
MGTSNTSLELAHAAQSAQASSNRYLQERDAALQALSLMGEDYSKLEQIARNEQRRIQYYKEEGEALREALAEANRILSTYFIDPCYPKEFGGSLKRGSDSSAS